MPNIEKINLCNTLVPSCLFDCTKFERNWGVEIVRVSDDRLIIGYHFDPDSNWELHVRFSIEFTGSSLIVDPQAFYSGLIAIDQLISKYINSINVEQVDYVVADVIVTVDRLGIDQQYTVNLTEDFY